MNPLGVLGLISAAGRILGGGASHQAHTGLESLDFEDLLEDARAGAITSGRPVVMGTQVQDLKLTTDQLQRLSAAADQAEAVGAEDILVLLDGMALRVDVASRMVTGVVDQASRQVFADVDAVITAPAADAAGARGPAAWPKGTVHPSILSALGAHTSSETEN